jgi:ATP-dependent DNA helicase RecG
MTTKTDLMEIIRNGENSGVEFKRDTLQNSDLARELVAFSNLEGGMVLLGVEDDGGISGLTREKLEEWVMTACRDKIRPPIIPFFEIVRDLEDNKDIAIVRISRGFDVHSLWHNNHLTYFIRVGTQSREPSTEELARLFAQRGAFRTELRPVSGTTFDDLDKRRLRDYFGRVRQQEVPATDAEWVTLLVNTDLMVHDGVTVGGLLLFGTNPNRFLQQARVEATAFPGKEKNYATRERASIRGPLTPLYGENGLIENGLVEQVLEFVRRNTPNTATLEDGVRRVDMPTYPVEVLRESVVNAVIHRDYLLSSSDIEVAVYDDRLEIISPGRLPNGITTSQMRAGCRAARNELLKDAMRDYGYLENLGMGIPRKIITGMKAHNGTEPELIEQGETFILRLLAV